MDLGPQTSRRPSCPPSRVELPDVPRVPGHPARAAAKGRKGLRGSAQPLAQPLNLDQTKLLVLSRTSWPHSTQGQADTAPRNALGTGNVSTLKIKQQTTPRKRVGRCWFANFPEDMLMESCPLPDQGKALPGLSGIVLWMEVPQSPCVPKCCDGVGEEVWLPAGQVAEESGLLVERAWAGERGALLPPSPGITLPSRLDLSAQPESSGRNHSIHRLHSHLPFWPAGGFLSRTQNHMVGRIPSLKKLTAPKGKQNT